MSNDRPYKRKIFNAALIVAVATVAAKGFSAVKDLIAASYLGTSDALDAFLLAYLIPFLLMSIVASSFCSAFVPVFMKIRSEQSSENLSIFIGEQIGRLVRWLCLMLFGLYLVHSPLVSFLAHDFSAEKRELTRVLFIIVAPTILLSGLTQLYAAILNAGERFLGAALLPALAPIGMMMALIFAPPEYLPYALGVGAVLGSAIQLLISLILVSQLGLRWTPSYSGAASRSSVEISLHMKSFLIASILMSGTDIVDQFMAAQMGSGSLASFSYGTKVTTFMLGVASTALSTATLPYFSAMAAEKRWSEIRSNLKFYALLTVLLSTPVVIGGCYYSEPLVRILFERGAFVAEDTRVVSSIQAVSLFQIPFYLLGILFVRVVTALQLSRLLMVSAVISLFVNAALNLLFSRWYGVVGIALSTVIVYLLAAIFYAAVCWFALYNGEKDSRKRAAR